MNQELVMMFNGEEAGKLCSNDVTSEVTPDKVFEAFCRGINSQDTAVIDSVPQNNVSFKESNCENMNGKIEFETFNSKFDQENLNPKVDCTSFVQNINGEPFHTISTSQAFTTHITSGTFTANVPSDTYSSNIGAETFTTAVYVSEPYAPNINAETFNANESCSTNISESYNTTIQNGTFTSNVGSTIFANINTEGLLSEQGLFTPTIDMEANKVNNDNAASTSKINFDQTEIQNFDQLITVEDEPKVVTIPDNWQITILETENGLSHSAEPLVISNEGVYQLYECPKCTALFREKDICESHIKNAHDYSCGLCNEPCQEKDDLINHIVQHISEFQVADTTENLSSESQVKPRKRKMETFSAKKQEYLDKIDDDDESSSQSPSRTSETTFSDYVPKSKKKALFICGICGKECDSEVSFQNHMTRSHSDNEPSQHICDVCNASFRSSFSLNNHKSYQHKPKVPKNFRCHVCDDRFSSNFELKEHIQSHEEIYPFPCDFCAEKYSSSAGLLNHIKLYHPNGRLFPCGECSKSFKCRKYLEAHVSEVHESQKKNCKYCGKVYRSTESLLAHIQEVHDKEERKYYDCDYCSQSFATERELKRHMEIHLSSIQVYDCDYCVRSFSNSRELKQHMDTHTNPKEDTFDCNWCSRSFGHKENLKIHVKIHHCPMYKEGEYD